MHIVIFVDFHDSSVGGVQTSVRGQRSGLERLGHKVTIVSPPAIIDVPDDLAVISVPAVPFVRPNGFPMVAPSRRNIRLIEKALDQLDPIDVIHVQTNMGVGLAGGIIARKRSLPLVQTMHGRDDVFAKSYPLPLLVTALQRQIHRCYVPHTSAVPRLDDSLVAHNAWQIMINQAQAADHVIMPSRHFADKFKRHGVTKPMDVISNGVSDAVVAKLPRALQKKDGKNVLRVMWCGRLSAEKRPLESIDIVSRIPGCQLDMYGDGPLAKTVEEYIVARGLSDRIHMKGKVDQAGILAAMQDHYVLLYPSFGFDNQPMVLLEAAAAGIPVVYCDPDLAECLPDGGGLLADDASVDALVIALETVIANPAMRHRMHELLHNHRDRIVQSYYSKKMVQLYQRLIKKSR